MHVPSVQPPDNPRPKRPKPRDHDASPQPTNIDERLIALKRRNAGATRAKEKEKIPVSPQVVISRPPEADPDDFSRRLNISSSPTPRTVQPASRQNQPSKLYNPERDPIPLIRRTTEPESMSDSTPSRSPNAMSRERNPASRQLFDPRKDDPVRFAVLARPGQRPTPTPKSSGEYISASSTSSYAPSQASSSFTLSSTTDGSSASSALFEHSRPSDEAPGNMFAQQLKKLYRNITNLEAKIKQEDADADEDGREGGRMIIKGKNSPEDEEVEKDKWLKQIDDHKKLVETIHNMLEISLAPSVPASLRNIPTKYNIIGRLWLFGFQRLLESLRQASLTSALALEHLQDFIYYAYTFYTGLLEEPPLAAFKSNWLEALGDLARYMMAVAAMVTGGAGTGSALTAANISEAASADSGDRLMVPTIEDSKSISDAIAARIDDSPSPSVGLAAARALEVEPEKERWRMIARGWYATGITDQPGTGKLHHHLGLLSRESEGEVLRAVYHFVKSMTTLHPFPTSREKILHIWSSTAQARRQLPDARGPDIFVLLHGMLFTNIQLDDFQSTLSRFMERLEIEGAEERDWIMMAIINIGAVLEYGKSSGILKRVGCFGSRDMGLSGMAMKAMAKKEVAARRDEDMDIDDDSASQGAAHTPETDIDPSELPMSFKLALQLTFTMFSHVLRRPTRKPSPYARSKLNPYLTVVLTFLATALKHKKTLELLERSIPWDDMVSFFATVPRNIMASQGLSSLSQVPSDGERWSRLTSGCAPPLPEDWCMRGMEWVGRMIFERGYWKSGEDKTVEIEVLDDTEAGEMTDGQIEDDDEEDKSNSDLSQAKKRWVRIIRSAVGIAGVVDGLTWIEGTREWRVDGVLSEKVRLWKEQERHEREEQEKRKMGMRWSDDSMDIDEDIEEEMSEESDDHDENDSEEIKELKARRRYLRSLLQSAGQSSSRRVPRSSKSEDTTRSLLPILPGYTVLVIDTNILLSSLSMFASLVESMYWTVLVPLPVIMELDGLKSNSSKLGEAAENALVYISSHIRSHSMSLKVQTSKGNYLTTLSVRTEDVDFASGNAERNMDDLILKTAIWHDEHWIDRSGMLKSDGITRNISNPIKVVLLSLDRNLRLKARSRQLPAAGEKDLAFLLSTGT